MTSLTHVPTHEPIRVLHVITGLEVGGAETMLWKLLSRLDRDRFEAQVVSLSSLGPMAPRIAELDIRVRALHMPSGMPDPRAFARLVRVMRRDRPHIVQTWMYHADLLGGLGARLASSPPVIWGVRQSLDPRSSKRHTLLTARACARLSARLPARIVSCSESLVDLHVDFGYTRKPFRVIPNGFDMSSFVPSAEIRRAVRAEFGFGSTTPVIGIVARFDPQKDHEMFVRAAGVISRRVPDAQFMMVGKDVDSDNPELGRWLDEENLVGRTWLLGRRGDIPRVTQAFDVATSSSVFGEGFSNVLGEAMSIGVPCVATDTGDAGQIIGDTGRVVSPRDVAGFADAVQSLLEMPIEERVALGAAARRRVLDRFELSSVTRRFERLYTELTGERQ